MVSSLEVRRVLSIALMLVVSLPLFAPVLAQGGQGGVPACCRRNGAHHCMMMADMMTHQPVAGMKCPAFPRAGAAGTVGVWTFASLPSLTHEQAVQRGAEGQVEAGYRISFYRARQKRGPPIHNS